ncbi:ATP-binding protein [Bradyrhizobium sp. McL0616]|uniref:ATP-binding protein n=1 Tax=Bradyrhizobium sp. McL0616 TaxID=3415674 RepID=UPI003CF39321
MPDVSIDQREGGNADLRRRLEMIKRRLRSEPVGEKPDPSETPIALDRLSRAFGLSAFETDLLLLCAGMELDSELRMLCAQAQNDPASPFPTFGLALTVLAEAHWSALSPEAPLRRWRLIDVAAGPILTRAALKIDERVVHFLVGVSQLDERLTSLLDPLATSTVNDLAPSHRLLAEQITDSWAEADRSRDLPIVQLSGPTADALPIAAAAAEALGLRAAMLPADRLPHAAEDLDQLLRLWEREAILSGLGVLLLDVSDTQAAESDAGRVRDEAVSRLLERISSPVILREREPRRITTRPAIVLSVGHPTGPEQLALWRESLGDLDLDDAAVAATANQFTFGASTIRTIATQLRAHAAAKPDEDLSADLWTFCRRRLRSALDGLAQRIDSNLTWDDLVLPEPQKETLRSIAAQLRQRTTVYNQWGFAAKSQRGLGLGALFYGPSGVGKTMAAEVLASEIQLDLYHIDLSRVVSKYIGETEKNLGRVFDAAEENGAILLFDEADSLFGARSEVRDSHDRYANIEVSYLLQRMEAYRGLAILTTNMRTALDPSFLRRLRFTVAFPFPDAEQRAEIWRHVFPKDAPTKGLQPERLAELRIPGGNIRNIALNAAFLAADAGEPVQMSHLLAAARTEYAKMDRRLTPVESAAWE